MSRSERDKVMQAVWGETKKASWQWPEEARRDLDIYVNAGAYTKKDREAAVRRIKSLIYRHAAETTDTGGKNVA